MLLNLMRPFSAVLLALAITSVGSIGQSYTISVTTDVPSTPSAVPLTIRPEYQDTVKLIATAFDTSGKAITSPLQFTWSQKDKDIVSVDAAGSIVALKPGSTIVYATAVDPADPAHAAVGRIFLNVSPGTLQSIAISGPTTLAVGQSGQFTATGTYLTRSNSKFIGPVIQGLSWTSGDANTVTIAPAGTAFGIAAKTTTTPITLTYPADPKVAITPAALNLTITPASLPTSPGAAIQFVGKLLSGNNTLTVQGTAKDTVMLYQFNSAYVPIGKTVCSKQDLANADQTISVIPSGTKQTSFTLSSNNPQTIALNLPLVVGTQLCAVQSPPAPTGTPATPAPQPTASDYSLLTTVADPGGYGRFTPYFTSGAVITNQQTTGTTSTASEYLDMNLDFSWQRAGVIRPVKSPKPDCGPDVPKNPCTKYHRGFGIDGFFAARLSTIPVAATATTNTPVTTTTTGANPTSTTSIVTNTNLNVLTAQQSAHIVLGGYLPFVFTRWNNKSNVLTVAPIAAAGFDTLLNPSISPSAVAAPSAGTTTTSTVTTTINTPSVTGNFSSVYSFYNAGLRLAWESYPKSTDLAPMTWMELRANFGKYSNLPTYICSAKPTGPYTTTSSSTPSNNGIANSACNKGVYSSANLNLPYDSRTLFERIDIQAKAQFPNYPFVLGLDANLAQYSVGRYKNFVDYQNKAGNDVRIFVGLTFNLLTAINKLNIGSF